MAMTNTDTRRQRTFRGRPPLAVCLVLFTVASIARAGGGAATQPGSAAERAHLDRGERVRQVLADTCLEATRHDGVWPERLAGPEAAALRLTYIRPPKMSADEIRWMLSPTVILYESLDEHPDGVWVGHADAHLEFAPNPAALEADRPADRNRAPRRSPSRRLRRRDQGRHQARHTAGGIGRVDAEHS